MLVPVLGAPVGEVLDELRVDGDVLRYHDHAFPLRDGTGDLPLPQLLDAQWYRPVWWRLARTDLNCRRSPASPSSSAYAWRTRRCSRQTHATVLRVLHEV